MAVVLNLDRLVDKLEKLEKSDFKKALIESCLLVENDARAKCPVDSGQLRGSITHEIDDKEGVVGTNVEYAPYVEYGTGMEAKDSEGNITGRKTPWSYYYPKIHRWVTTTGNKPQPFLEPALLDNQEKIVKIFKRKVEEEVK